MSCTIDLLIHVTSVVAMTTVPTPQQKRRNLLLCKTFQIFAYKNHTLNHRPQICYKCVELLIMLEVPTQIQGATVSALRTHFQIYRTTSKLSCIVRTATVPLPSALTILPSDEVAVAFMRLAPTFKRISHYTPCIIIRFNFGNINRSLLLNCIYIFLGISVFIKREHCRPITMAARCKA
jgi:hypothetical protein